MSDIGILVPIAGISMAALSVWLKHQRRMAELHLRGVAEKAAQYASEKSQLEERVRVLERIVTDGGYDTALQIEALRDARAVENADREAPVTGPRLGETRQ